MKKLNKDYFQKHYLMAYKSVAWWEEEINEYVSFFEQASNKKNKYSKRIIKINEKAYTSLMKRGGIEAKILYKIEKEFEKYNAKKKKK